METTSDVFLENNMLQSENDKLRTRIKSLNDTVEQLTVRNTQLLSDQALVGLGNAAGDATSEEVVNLVKGYVKELEEMRLVRIELNKSKSTWNLMSVMTETGDCTKHRGKASITHSFGHFSLRTAI